MVPGPETAVLYGSDIAQEVGRPHPASVHACRTGAQRSWITDACILRWQSVAQAPTCQQSPAPYSAVHTSLYADTTPDIRLFTQQSTTPEEQATDESRAQQSNQFVH
jgi:hypothetical protein